MRVRVVVAGLLLMAAACGGSPSAPRASATPTQSVSHNVITAAATSTSTSTGTRAPCGWRARTTYSHVVWIWMENRSYSAVLGSSGSAPRLTSFARQCGLATDYWAVSHPSLPNYLAAVSGSTGGVSSDCSPSSCPQRRGSLYAQVAAHGRAWRGYAESMSAPCDRASYDSYAARHNPVVYFTPIRSPCTRWDVPMGGTSGAFAHALSASRLPAFAFVTPNLCHDGHDCNTSTADQWLGTWLGRIAGSAAYRAGSTVVFVTWDEGEGSDNRVATVVMAPTVHPGTRYAGRLTHYSLLRTTEQLLGLPALGQAATARSMRTPFHL
jgi:phosphatidylinositol-3-phosphatase